jgi:serine/threonine protein kinase
VILYEMVSGRLPYRGDDLVELMHRQVKDPPDPMPSWVPARVRAIVVHLMAKNPDDRYPSATAAQAALAEVRRELEHSHTPMRAAARRIADAVSSLPSLLRRGRSE